MARPARIHFHFVELARDGAFVDYAVEARQARKSWTVGRISGALGSYPGPAWNALPVGGTAWTRNHGTRRAAFAALLAREDFRYTDTWTACDCARCARAARNCAA